MPLEKSFNGISKITNLSKDVSDQLRMPFDENNEVVNCHMRTCKLYPEIYSVSIRLLIKTLRHLKKH